MNECNSTSRCIHNVLFSDVCPYCSYEHSSAYTEKTTMPAPDKHPEATDHMHESPAHQTVFDATASPHKPIDDHLLEEASGLWPLPECPPLSKELDPDGISQHEPGAKLDAGKPRVSLVLGGFARALWAISEVGTSGAAKYTDNGWMEVDQGVERYADAGLRHFLKEAMGEEIDPDFELLHMAHEAWNALAKLELRLREKRSETDTSTQAEAASD